jgi:hypothetical protein
MIKSEILIQELSGLVDVAGCNDNGEVWMTDGTRIQSRSDVVAIINIHLSTVYDLDERGQLKKVEQAEIIFDKPIVAPAGTFGDVYVASPKTENTAEAALEVAKAEASKVGKKSIARMILNLAEKYLPDLEAKIKKAKL